MKNSSVSQQLALQLAWRPKTRSNDMPCFEGIPSRRAWLQDAVVAANSGLSNMRNHQISVDLALQFLLLTPPAIHTPQLPAKGRSDSVLLLTRLMTTQPNILISLRFVFNPTRLGSPWKDRG